MRRVLTGMIALLITSFSATIPAAAQQSIYTAECENGRQIVGTRYTFLDLNPDTPYRVTLLGVDTFDPVMAFIDEEDRAVCSDNDADLLGSQIAIPGAGAVNANAFSTQQVFRPPTDGSLTLLVGGYAGQTGRYVFVIEGLSIDPRDETDRLLVDVPPSALGELHGVYMIAQTETVDPYMELTLPDSDIALLATCDNAGTPDCPATLSIVDNGAVLTTGGRYVGKAADAGLLHTVETPQLEYRFATSRGRTLGNYGVIITGTAPGDPADPRLICDNVATRINGISSTYSDLYPAQNAVDGSPETFWAAGVGEIDPESSVPLQNVFIVVGFDGERRVDTVRINGYAPDPRFRANSLRRFRVVLNNASENVVTALETDVRLHPGYQTFSFLPVEVDELALVLLTNNGGSQFVIADIQVCAAR